jgi:RNA methyltransferase, TrmH family
MLSKKEAKDIQSLSHKKFRQESRLFVAEGPKVVGELLAQMPRQLVKVYAVAGWIEEHATILKGIEYMELQESELKRVSHLTTPNQVLALFNQLPGQVPADEGFTLYLDTIQDPGNFGTLIRIADWFGVSDVVCSAGCADLYNPKVVQSTMASLGRVNVYYDETEQWLFRQARPSFAAVLNGSSLYDQPRVSEGILLIGNESKGLRTELIPPAAKKLTIPRRGKAESLNASVATGIILSHLLK